MLIKKNSGGYIKHLLTRLNRAIAGRKTLVVVKKLGSVSTVLNILVREGFIKSYVEYPDLVVIMLKVSCTNFRSESINEIRSVARFGRKTALPLQSLKITLQKSGTTPCTILHTDKGLLTSLEAVRLNVGGKGLIQII